VYRIDHADPPQDFRDTDVTLECTELIDFKGLPFDPFAFCLFVMPPGIRPDDRSHDGNHTFILDGLNTAYANVGWIIYHDDIGAMARVFSHELVEAMTDPHGYGVQVNPTSLTDWYEVADVCASYAVSNGAVVASYWLDQDKACVVPISVQVRNRQITCVRKVPRADPHHAIKLVGGISVESRQPF
jgi:hypothetical protein